MLAAMTHPSRVLNLDMKANALYAKELYLTADSTVPLYTVQYCTTIYIYIYIYIVGGKRQINYKFTPTSLFRGCSLIRDLMRIIFIIAFIQYNLIYAARNLIVSCVGGLCFCGGRKTRVHSFCGDA